MRKITPQKTLFNLLMIVASCTAATSKATNNQHPQTKATHIQTVEPQSDRADSIRLDDSIKIGTDLFVRKIGELPVWIVVHKKPIEANSLVLLTREGIPILADTPWTPGATRELLDWIKSQFGTSPALATISHFHFDASGGIQTLLDAKIPVIASTETARLLKKRGASMQAELLKIHGDQFNGWDVPQPDTTFDPSIGYATTIGGTKLHVIFPGQGHSPDNVITWFPELGVLFGGCLVKGGNSLGYLGDANLRTYPSAMDVLIHLNPKVVISGHGDRIDPAQLTNTQNLAQQEKQKNEPNYLSHTQKSCQIDLNQFK